MPKDVKNNSNTEIISEALIEDIRFAKKKNLGPFAVESRIFDSLRYTKELFKEGRISAEEMSEINSNIRSSCGRYIVERNYSEENNTNKNIM